MKKKVWHCDRCGAEINAAPKSFIYMDHDGRQNFDRVHVEHYSVRYGVYMGCSICEKCKIEVLEKALKKLKEAKEQSQIAYICYFVKLTLRNIRKINFNPMIDFVKNEIKLYLQYGNGGNSVNVSNKRNGATDELRCHN